MNEQESGYQEGFRSKNKGKVTGDSKTIESDGPFCVLKPGYFQGRLERLVTPRSRETSVLIMERWDGKVWRAEF